MVKSGCQLDICPCASVEMTMVATSAPCRVMRVVLLVVQVCVGPHTRVPDAGILAWRASAYGRAQQPVKATYASYQREASPGVCATQAVVRASLPQAASLEFALA